MNLDDTIGWLAVMNCGSMYPKRLEEVAVNIPYFEVFKNSFWKIRYQHVQLRNS